MQINRMFEIIYLLLDKKTVTAKELAQRFEVSPRTIYRDIEALSAAGIPVYMTKGKGGGISLLDNFVLSKAMLTDQERNDILLSLKAVRATRFTETDSVLQKLSGMFGGHDADWFEIDFSSWYHTEEEEALFHQLKSAILSKHVISFTYASGKGQRTQRKVEPLKLCFKAMDRYLYAYCTLRKDFRFFKLTRIRNCATLDEQFHRQLTQPVFEENEFFPEPCVTLKLRLSPEMAFRVYDEFDSYVQEPDGSFIAQVSHPAGDWLFPYISSFGSHCEVLEPLQAREFTKSELQKMLKHYL